MKEVITSRILGAISLFLVMLYFSGRPAEGSETPGQAGWGIVSLSPKHLTCGCLEDRKA